MQYSYHYTGNVYSDNIRKYKQNAHQYNSNTIKIDSIEIDAYGIMVVNLQNDQHCQNKSQFENINDINPTLGYVDGMIGNVMHTNRKLSEGEYYQMVNHRHDINTNNITYIAKDDKPNIIIGKKKNLLNIKHKCQNEVTNNNNNNNQNKKCNMTKSLYDNAVYDGKIKKFYLSNNDTNEIWCIQSSELTSPVLSDEISSNESSSDESSSSQQPWISDKQSTPTNEESSTSESSSMESSPSQQPWISDDESTHKKEVD